MLAGVGLGFLLTYYSTHFASTGIRNFQSMYEGDITLAAIKSQNREVFLPLNTSARLSAFSHVGGYVYLPGLCLFVLARHRRWKKALHENTKHTEQGGPAYPPQGVGSADP
jgi:hypothetical protein